jgi:hypothetical protein
MYQYNDRLTQLFTKYNIYLAWATMFRPLTGSSSGLHNNLENVVLGKELCLTVIRLIHRIQNETHVHINLFSHNDR